MTRRSKAAAAAPSANIVGRAEGELAAIPKATWTQLAKRAAILRSAGDDGMTRATAERAALALGVHPTTVYRWRRRLREAGLVTALQSRKRGFPSGDGRLSQGQVSVSLQSVTFVLSLCHQPMRHNLLMRKRFLDVLPRAASD